MIAGHTRTQLVYLAARLRLADRLASGPRPSAELAREVGVDAPALHRLLRALAEIELVVEVEEGVFQLTPVGEHLREDAPNSLHAAAICAGETFSRAWGDLLESVRTGETAFERVFGVPIFDYLSQRPELGETFGRYLSASSAAVEAVVVETYGFSPFRCIVDVGGGRGTLLTAILRANPSATGVLFDLPPVIARAEPWIEEQGLAGRCRPVAGSFFEAVPEGGDLYLLKWILHDWDDERAIRILQGCRRAMDSNARLLVLESVMPERMTPDHTGALVDIQMLVLTGGRERTEAEWRALLDRGGFRLARVMPTPPSARSPILAAGVSLMEALPI
jgi:hypothetical protein